MKICLFMTLFLLPLKTFADPIIIDDFSYQDSAAAQAAWQERSGSLPVEMADSGPWGDARLMKAPCNFSVQQSRSYWDRNVALDLSGYREFALELFAPDPGSISHLSLYFHSGDGWYSGSKNISSPGWQTVYFAVNEFGTEGTVAGWNNIDIIRISPWKESDQDTFLALRSLRAFTPLVFLVRDTGSSDPKTVRRTIELLSNYLGAYNVSYGVIDDVDVEEGYLAGSKMAVFPFNSLSDQALTATENYVANGGKLMVYYNLDSTIADLLGFERTGWTRGDFASYTFEDDVIQNLPSRVLQHSWNITIAQASNNYNARAIAQWEDSQGTLMGYPAWLASDRGLFMSHIILGEDAQNKQLMLLALIGHYVPEIWPTAAEAALEKIGRIADYLTYEDAVADIRATGSQTSRVQQVESSLSQAETLRKNAYSLYSSGEYAQTILVALDARTSLLQAYYLSRSPVEPEFRAVWEHAGTGPYPGDWQTAIDVLAENNFTAVFTNMLRGGLAHYDSAYLPHSEIFDTYGDQISQCIDAAHKKGIQVHVWKVNWNLSAAPQSFIDEMRAAGRTQVDRYGEPVDWLCPSNPDNQQLEHDSMLEVVQNYDVDGIHFDYIRYPNADSCYCDACRARFEEQTGNTVTTWPDDVLNGGALESDFQDWRRQQITNLVSWVYQDVKAIKPQVQVSAAVFSRYPSCRESVGQDWVEWINEGIVDFLCPMDYTEDFDYFENIVGGQLAFAENRIPIYPGIGASSSSSTMGPDGVIVQIQTTRDLQTGGFIIFNYDRDLAESTLPALGMGVTSDLSQDGGTDGGTDAGHEEPATEEPSIDAGLDAGIDGSTTDVGSDKSHATDESLDKVGGGCGCHLTDTTKGNNNHALLLFIGLCFALALKRKS